MVPAVWQVDSSAHLPQQAPQSGMPVAFRFKRPGSTWQLCHSWLIGPVTTSVWGSAWLGGLPREGFPGGAAGKDCLPIQETQETRVRSLGWEDSPEESMATVPTSSNEKSHGQRSLVGFSLRGHSIGHDSTRWLAQGRGLLVSVDRHSAATRTPTMPVSGRL